MDDHEQIKKTTTMISNPGKTSIIDLPPQALCNILSLCCHSASELVNFVMTSPVIYSIFRENSEYVYYCAFKALMKRRHRDANRGLIKIDTVDSADLMSALEVDVARNYWSQEPGHVIKTWESLYKNTLIAHEHMRQGQATPWLQAKLPSNEVYRNIRREAEYHTLDFSVKHNILIKHTTHTHVLSVYGPDEIKWDFESAHKILWKFFIDGDYLVITTEFYSCYVFRIVEVSSECMDHEIPLCPDVHFVSDCGVSGGQKIQCPFLRYHWSITDMPSFEIVSFQSPYLVIETRKDNRHVIHIWNLTTREREECISGWSGRTDDLSFNPGSPLICRINDENSGHIKRLEVYKRIDLTWTRYDFPPNHAALRQSWLDQDWINVCYDSVTMVMVAISRQGRFLVITDLPQLVEGSKTWDECAFYVDFSGPYYTTEFHCLRISAGQVIISAKIHDRISHLLRDISPIMTIELAKLQSGAFSSNLNQFNMISPVASKGRIEVLGGGVFIAGQQAFLENKKDLETFRNIGQSWLRYVIQKGIYWQDSCGNQLGHAWDHPENTDSVTKIDWYWFSSCLRDFCEPNRGYDAVIGYAFSRNNGSACS